MSGPDTPVPDGRSVGPARPPGAPVLGFDQWMVVDAVVGG